MSGGGGDGTASVAPSGGTWGSGIYQPFFAGPVSGGPGGAGPASPNAYTYNVNPSGGGGGVNWNDVATALKQLGSAGQGQGQGGAGAGSQQRAEVGSSQSQIGRPTSGGELSNLVQLMMQRAAQYGTAATNPQGAQPVQIQRPAGILGY